MPVVDTFLVVTFILMLAGAVWGWQQGYAGFDTATAVWLIVMAAVLAVIISPWPHRHTYW